MCLIRNNSYLLLLIILILISGCASKANIKMVEVKNPVKVPLGTETKPIQFKKIVVKLERGQDIGSIQGGLLCIPGSELVWKGGKVSIEDKNTRNPEHT